VSAIREDTSGPHHIHGGVRHVAAPWFTGPNRTVTRWGRVSQVPIRYKQRGGRPLVLRPA
jgi:hypothetical protein